MPPPNVVALFPEKVELVTVSVPTAAMPPPFAALLLEKVELMMVAVWLLKMPPPNTDDVLFKNLELVIVSVPW